MDKSKIKTSISINSGTVGYILLCGILIAVTSMIIVFSNVNKTSNQSANSKSNQTITEQVSGDKQVINLLAQIGYSPKNQEAKSGVDSVLKIETNKTFDCSSAISIPSLKFRKNLPSTGVAEVNIPAQKPGTKINGTCSMGMFSFSITFI